MTPSKADTALLLRFLNGEAAHGGGGAQFFRGRWLGADVDGQRNQTKGEGER